MGPCAQSIFHRWTKKRVVLAAALVAVGAMLVIVAIRMGLVAAAETMVLRLREAGPAVFFVAMALLPAVGFPMIAFTLAAGPVFGPTLGTGGVILCSVAAVVVNLLLTYWLANRALRPLVGRLLTYFDFHLPNGAAGGAWQMALIVRLTPGPPFWVQSYLLGLIKVPLAPYLVVSTFVMTGFIVALVCGGEAITNGDGRRAVAAVGALVVIVAAVQLVRKRTARGRSMSALAANPAK